MLHLLLLAILPLSGLTFDLLQDDLNRSSGSGKLFTHSLEFQLTSLYQYCTELILIYNINQELLPVIGIAANHLALGREKDLKTRLKAALKMVLLLEETTIRAGAMVDLHMSATISNRGQSMIIWRTGLPHSMELPDKAARAASVTNSLSPPVQ